MVSSTRTASRLMIIARPNHSATWHSNLVVLTALAVPSLVVAVVFAVLGAWVILPFAGLELLALGAALYKVNWKLQFRQIITVSANSVRVEQGFRTPCRSWQFQRQATGLTITREHHPWDGPSLCLHDSHQNVSLGEFLNKEEVLQLIQLLDKEIRVRSRSHRETQSF